MNLTRRIARPMLASVFVADGVDALLHPDAHVAQFKKVTPLLEKAGLPPVLTSDAKMLTRVLGGVTAVSGLMLATGRNPRSAALTLALVNVPLTVVNNPVWAANGPQQRKQFSSGLLRGVGLGGGLLLAAKDLAGKPSWGWRWSNAREHAVEVREARAAAKAKYKG
ncbi:DoxX family protein [Georgenia sp. TF02-10]|uniref:DoxX family protein n=1 Tax=Georgenia sp. TF02-10 TaxID=2917725 RepID=UPI001FA7EDDE|nr:DoxX family protein [Georgenia sp. TF02-10]UNX54013.1 DoxX family protein [Georgenia sp. TF02-10]